MINIRQAAPSDTHDVLSMMKRLAAFEGYLESFNMDTAAVREVLSHQGNINIFVSQRQEARCDALAVTYWQPLTYDKRPWLVIKEFYVEEHSRGQDVGRRLFEYVESFARAHYASLIKWDVLESNARAKRFYERQGAKHDAKWQPYIKALSY